MRKEKLGIKFCGPLLDASGYAQFGRAFISGLYKRSDVSLSLELLSFEKNKPHIGDLEKVIKELANTKVDYKIKVVNALPTHMATLKEEGKKNVCFTMFETSRIPDQWVQSLNTHADACFVPCTWNKDVFEQSGVTIPVYVVYPGIDADYYRNIDAIPKVELSSIGDNDISFYSIFQWTERKNPTGLLNEYFSAFDGVEDVCLVLKTYGSNTEASEQQRIKDLIRSIKSKLLLKKAPKIMFIGDLLSNEQITGLHKRCDCFVLPHRAEGFGMPHIEAMACGKPVITTGFSGNMDFMNRENSYLLDYQMTVVCNMTWINVYEADMEWAEPNISQLKKYMKQVYSDIKAARENKNTMTKTLALNGQKDVLGKFNLHTAAESFISACRKVIV